MLSNKVIKCPWCKSQFVKLTTANCNNCGGTLEYEQNINLTGLKPPFAPRELPKKFIFRQKYSRNVYSILGVVFTIPFFWTVIFPIIGIILWRKGLKDANNELLPLQNGQAVLGEITNIKKDYTKKINNESPFVIEFLFEANGQKRSGTVGNIFTPLNELKQVGDKVWVVYMPDDPELSSLWPPIS